jgi:hypothetical protein
VVIEGKRLTDAALAHDGEADGISQAEVLIAVAAEDGLGLRMELSTRESITTFRLARNVRRKRRAVRYPERFRSMACASATTRPVVTKVRPCVTNQP